MNYLHVMMLVIFPEVELCVFLVVISAKSLFFICEKNEETEQRGAGRRKKKRASTQMSDRHLSTFKRKKKLRSRRRIFLDKSQWKIIHCNSKFDFFR